MPDIPPLMQFDRSPEALLNPASPIRPSEFPARGVLCNFRDVLTTLESEARQTPIASHMWEHGATRERRAWQSRSDVRRQLFMLALDACLLH